MSLNVAFQMDHIDTLSISGDTTFALCLEAQKRGHKIFHYTPDKLTYKNGKTTSLIEPLQVMDDEDNPTGERISIFHYLFLPMLKNVCREMKIKNINVLQGRSFLQFPLNLKDRTVDTPHIDLHNRKHLVALYYVCDSDGDTIIYNEREELGTYTIKQKVTPKQGRMVLFDGSLYHTAEQPLNNVRCVVNYNLG